MKVLGITAEYNPFHRGHKYHLDKAKEMSGADVTVVVMSGCFTQRGEAAIADKWIRSETAIKSGADLVIELPFLFACNRAECFAAGAVDILAASGATHIAFGCESENADEIRAAAAGIVSEKDAIEQLRRRLMKEGKSYARANEKAVRETVGEYAGDLILQPNNILAVEYVKRLEYYRSKGRIIQTIPIRRRGSGYDDVNPGEKYAGATAIRRMNINDMRDYVTPESWAYLKTMEPLPDRESEFFRILRGIIMRAEASELADIYSVGEGFENKLKKEIVRADNMSELINSLVSARYTAATVRRILVNVLVGVPGRDADIVLDKGESAASYLRILAAGEKGREYLKMLKKSDEAPLQITNVNKVTELTDEVGSIVLKYDLKAADIYNLISGYDVVKNSDRVRKPYIELHK